MQRFFVEPNAITADHVRITDAEIIHQMQRVLRMRPGDSFIILDGSENEYVCVLETSAPPFYESACRPKRHPRESHEIFGKITEKRRGESEPEHHVTLYQALPKKAALFEWVLQKGTEIGISRFVPLVTARTERVHLGKPERLRKIIQEAAEQSERGKLPALGEPEKFEMILQEPRAEESCRILLEARGDFPQLKNELEKIKKYKTVSLFVGPEGGFSPNEIAQAEKSGVLICGLGKRILRTETAGIVAASIFLLA